MKDDSALGGKRVSKFKLQQLSKGGEAEERKQSSSASKALNPKFNFGGDESGPKDGSKTSLDPQAKMFEKLGYSITPSGKGRRLSNFGVGAINSDADE